MSTRWRKRKPRVLDMHTATVFKNRLIERLTAHERHDLIGHVNVVHRSIIDSVLKSQTKKGPQKNDD